MTEYEGGKLMYDELMKRLRELHPEEFGNQWDFAFACQQAMHEAADAIEELNKQLEEYHKYDSFLAIHGIF